MPGWVNTVATFVQLAASSSNPFIYGIFRTEFRKAFIRQLNKLLHKFGCRDYMTDTLTKGVSKKSLGQSQKKKFTNGDTILNNQKKRHRSHGKSSVPDLVIQSITEADENSTCSAERSPVKPVYFINTAASLEEESEEGSADAPQDADSESTENLVTEDITNNNINSTDLNKSTRN